MYYLKTIRIALRVVRFFNEKAYLHILLRLFNRPPKRKTLKINSSYGFEVLDYKINDNLEFTLYQKGYSDILIIFAHGWGSKFQDFKHFFQPIFREDISIIGFDAPAHGSSPGKFTNILKFKEIVKHCLQEIQGQKEIVVIGHSIGASAAALAILEVPKIKISCFFLIAAPSNLTKILDNFAGTMGCSKKDKTALEEKIKKTYKIDFKTNSLINNDRPTNVQQIILIHDRADEKMVYDESIDLAYRWKINENKDIWTIENSGHHKILKNKSVIENIISKILPR
ncbi:alpha/beta hydrolase [Sphingobacterium sp. lm-10]|uniref:alpha/beta hydrolase family protein n=1 Tax=Sphingobacterium sp. lm-10 TaxID=2944904 RepID=UPI002020802B|nr:alpha/beta hydrolase [Sphingobacterium sp. lm-10]MCL7986524.1 alpha/beta hydrolase [Sphingobacterium sp. lm-10]